MNEKKRRRIELGRRDVLKIAAGTGAFAITAKVFGAEGVGKAPGGISPAQAGPPPGKAKQPPPKPREVVPPQGGPYNLLIIMADQYRSDYFGCAGHPFVKTPNLDALAATGVFCPNLYNEMPVSGPSRSSIITGRFPSVHGVRQNRWKLPEAEIPFTEAMKKAGYRTVAVVSNLNIRTCLEPTQWAGFPQDKVGEVMAKYPQGFERGFDDFFFHDDMLLHKTRGEAAEKGFPRHFDKTETCSYALTQETVKWLDANGKKGPFFLWLDYLDPHWPLMPPVPYDDMYAGDYKGEWDWGNKQGFETAPKEYGDYRNKLYAGECSYVDENVGEVLKKVDQLGLREKTLIVFMSDHGEMQGEHNLWDKPPALYEPLARTPIIFNNPNLGIPKGKKMETLVQSVDVLPTVLDLLGIEWPEPDALRRERWQGTSLIPALKGEKEQVHEHIFLDHSSNDMKGVRKGDWKLIFNEKRQFELYNLGDDPGENNDLAGKDPKKLAEMKDLLIDLMARNQSKLRLGRTFGEVTL